jgi:hypothetical protein
MLTARQAGAHALFVVLVSILLGALAPAFA